ncbi:MAG TPA: efflux RND transporter periplasmic adaptor subunit [Candidatus Coprenecus stercoravium]|uniref:Efflux RND transporter periplasmic adaptor subunit n=1 Tax=Candidatus Coprenecus stercoravium TaxID=2840735 RepID=A0A9D2GQP1_9BACT|nr:efflux RND transporter periplasmic adaptor subunit [Candidatus Coprenecus stercoravium]
MKFKAIAVIAAAALLSGCGANNEEVSQDRVEQVRTSPLEYQEVSRQIELSTTLQGYEEMNISPSLTGIIEKIYVEVGDRVRKGDTLVRMDRNQLNTTRLAYANLQIEMDRVEMLLESEAISQQTYDQTKLSFDQTAESLRFLEENTFVLAQYDGVISSKSYEDGELYAGAQPILRLTQIDELKAYVNVPETYFPLVKKGMKVNVYSDIYPDKVFPATIEIVYPTIDPASHTFTLKLRIPNSSELIRPGMYVSTVLDLGRTEALVVPYQSVLRLIGSNNRYVFVDEGGVAKRVFVEIGERHDQTIEISSDSLKVGDMIVTTGQAKLVDGVRLNVVK